MSTTRRFSKTPSHAGVPFKGFPHNSFPSRESVTDQLDAFLQVTLEASEPLLKVILGDWGEGKSELLQGYLENRTRELGIRIVHCVASSLANAYSSSQTKTTLGSETRESIRFLVCALQAIYDDTFNHGNDVSDMDPKLSRDAIHYIGKAMRFLLKGHERVLLFIDEFEELLARHELVPILEGLKEVLNKQYAPLGDAIEDKQMAGRLHIMLACTPDAYLKLPGDQVTGEIFGGLARRLTKVKLLPISLNESIQFLQKLTSWCFDDKIPEPHPFSDQGIFETLHRISQGNLGNLVMIYTHLLSSSTAATGIEKNTMKVISPSFVIESLKNLEISAYGGTEEAVSTRVLDALIDRIRSLGNTTLKEDTLSILSLLLGSLRPHCLSELAANSQTAGTDQRVLNAINYIEQSLAQLGFPRGVVTLNPLKEGLNLKEVLQRLDMIFAVPGTETVLSIANEEYREEDLRKLLEHIDGNGKLQIYFPENRESFEKLFGQVRQQQGVQVQRICNKIADRESRCFTWTPAVLDSLFPTPVPPGLEFVKDKRRRLDIWRKVKTEFDVLFKGSAHLLADLLVKKSRFKGYIHRMEEINAAVVEAATGNPRLEYGIYAANPCVDVDDIRYIKGLFSKHPNLHVVLVFTTGEVTPEARNLKEFSELQKDRLGVERAMFFHIHRLDCRKLLAMSEASRTHVPIDELAEERTERSILELDLRIADRIEDWVRKHEQIGFVISDPILQATTSPRDLGLVMRFFVNFLEKEMKVKEFYEANNDYQDFVLYGQKTSVSFTPDKDEREVEAAAADLVANGLLEKRGRVFSVTESPPEKMIEELLKAEGPLSQADIESKTVRNYANAHTVADLYLSVLEYKGTLVRIKDGFSLNTLDNAFDEARKAYDEFTEEVDREEQKRALRKWGIIFMSKKRGTRAIPFSRFRSFIEDQYKSIDGLLKDKTVPERVVVSRCRRLVTLLEHYRSHLEPLYSAAHLEGEKLEQEMFRRARDVLNSVSRAIAGMQLAFDVQDGDILEVAQIGQIVEDAKLKLAEPIEGMLSEKEPKKFMFDDSRAEECFFNPKLLWLREAREELEKVASIIESRVRTIEDCIRPIDTLKGDVRQQVATLDVHDCNTTGMLVQRVMSVFEKDSQRSSIRLPTKPMGIEDLARSVGLNLKPLEEGLRDLSFALRKMDNAVKAEREMNVAFKLSEKSLKQAKRVFLPQSYEPYRKRETALVMSVADIQQRIGEVELKKLSDFVIEMTEAMRVTRKGYEELRNDINEEWAGWIRSKKVTLEAMLKQATSVSGAGQKLSEMCEKCRFAIQMATTDFDNLDESLTMAYFLTVLEEIGRLVASLFEKTLGREPYEVFKALEECIGDATGGALGKSEAIDIVEQRTGIARQVVVDALQVLVTQGIIEELLILKTSSTQPVHGVGRKDST